jgi:hypothetical protein
MNALAAIITLVGALSLLAFQTVVAVPQLGPGPTCAQWTTCYRCHYECFFCPTAFLDFCKVSAPDAFCASPEGKIEVLCIGCKLAEAFCTEPNCDCSQDYQNCGLEPPNCLTPTVTMPTTGGNCPTQVGSTGPPSCGPFPGVQNQVDCQLQANVVIISAGSGQLACGTVQPLMCGQTTFPAAAFWCNYCMANPAGIIDTSCFDTYFGVPTQSIACVAYPSCL